MTRINFFEDFGHISGIKKFSLSELRKSVTFNMEDLEDQCNHVLTTLANSTWCGLWSHAVAGGRGIVSNCPSYHQAFLNHVTVPTLSSGKYNSVNRQTGLFNYKACLSDAFLILPHTFTTNKSDI